MTVEVLVDMPRRTNGLKHDEFTALIAEADLSDIESSDGSLCEEEVSKEITSTPAMTAALPTTAVIYRPSAASAAEQRRSSAVSGQAETQANTTGPGDFEAPIGWASEQADGMAEEDLPMRTDGLSHDVFAALIDHAGLEELAIDSSQEAESSWMREQS
eukprot:gb/GFBE01042548.1/.p1 GENE.gb/GFBE01042548.1/~~gb/GFBE01042548.1/.p1  ORF type:complete len:159 (+),score=38.74 gb/GFBE01042548.1/:1-477(+)